MKLTEKQKDLLTSVISFFTDPPEEELQKVFGLIFFAKYQKNQYLLQAGEVPSKIFFNLSGLLRLFYIDYKGSEVNKRFCVENTCAVSYSAFISRKPSNIYIQALEDTSLLVMDYQDYHELVHGNRCWQWAALKFTEVMFIIKERKEAEFLLYDAAERYAHFLEEYPGIESRLPQYHIASYLGITPESLSRIRSSF